MLSLGFWVVIRLTKKKDIAINFGSRLFRWITLAGLSTVIAVIVVLALWVLERNRSEIINATKNNLQITLENAESRLNLWIKQRTTYLESLGRDPKLTLLADSLLAMDASSESLLASTALRDIREFFEDRRQDFPNIGFFIIDPDGISVGSIRDTNIGTVNLIAKHHPDLIERAFAGEVMFVPPMASDVDLSDTTGADTESNPPTMFLLGPVSETDGNVISRYDTAHRACR